MQYLPFSECHLPYGILFLLISVYRSYAPVPIEERAKRRYKENQGKNINMSYEEVIENIRKRDENDKAKEIGALKKAKDSIVIDTTKLTIEEVVEKIIEIIKNKNSRL